MLPADLELLIDDAIKACELCSTKNGYVPLLERYHGMGHALLLCNDPKTDRYFLWIVGGSCGQEAEYNYQEFINLTENQITWKTKEDAVAEFTKFEI